MAFHEVRLPARLALRPGFDRERHVHAGHFLVVADVGFLFELHAAHLAE